MLLNKIMNIFLAVILTGMIGIMLASVWLILIGIHSKIN